MSHAASPRAPLAARLFAPVDAASLGAFRIAFGAIVLWEASRYFSHGWIREYFVAPTFLFKYFGFGWVRPWPGVGMYVHFWALGVVGALVLFGAFYRLAAALLFLAITHVFLLDQTQYLNHIYLVCLVAFLMVFLPADRAFSLAARRRSGPATVPAWCLWTLRWQVGLVYTFAGIAKLNEDWLAGQPLTMWLDDLDSVPLLGPVLGTSTFAHAASLAGLALDLLVFPALLWRRTRTAALVVAILFHLTNAWWFRIGIFPWFMIAATLLFLPPDWPRRLWRTRGARAAAAAPDARAAGAAAPRSRAPVLLALGVWFAIQVGMPLRHWVYPGNVHWTEEGHRFSWHMKLRDKEGSIVFLVSDPAGREIVEVDPAGTLAARQVRKMSVRPDMILQFAHHLADEQQAATGRRPAVAAWAEVSLNGREPQLLIDPGVDLAAEPRTLAHADWILPLTSRRVGASEDAPEASPVAAPSIAPDAAADADPGDAPPR